MKLWTSALRGLMVSSLAVSLSGLGGCALFSSSESLDDQRTLPGEEASGQVVDPDTQRPKVAIRGIKAEDFEIGGYAGLIDTEKQHALGLYGVRATYNKSDLFFVEAHYATASTFIFNDLRDWIGKNKARDLSYDSYGFDMGLNLIPGELYFGPHYTVPITVYALAGVGMTNYEGDSFGAYRFGGGVKLFPLDRWSIRLEAVDNYWSKNGGDHNLEINLGVGFFF